MRPVNCAADTYMINLGSHRGGGGGGGGGGKSNPQRQLKFTFPDTKLKCSNVTRDTSDKICMMNSLFKFNVGNGETP